MMSTLRNTDPSLKSSIEKQRKRCCCQGWMYNGASPAQDHKDGGHALAITGPRPPDTPEAQASFIYASR